MIPGTCSAGVFVPMKNEKWLFFVCFYLILVYLPGLGVSEIQTEYVCTYARAFVLSWSHLDEIGEKRQFFVGQVPRTSHVTTRPKNLVRDASVPRCRGLWQQAPPPVCSCCRRCRADTRICSWTKLHSFSCLFCFVLFFGWFF